MQEREGAVSFQGTPLTLRGNVLKVGDAAPDFEALDNTMAPLRLAAFKERLRIVASVPSVDTVLCDQEARRLNKMAHELAEDVVILPISMDLPFALERWCGVSHVRDIYTLSDHRKAEFGKKYGVLIKELRLLSRAIFVIDEADVLRHIEYVPELAQHPDYEAVIDAIRRIVEERKR
jgi:thiol peroxidase